MPRVKRRGHKQRVRYCAGTRAQIIRALVDGWDIDDSPLLAGIPPAERESIVKEAWSLHFKERHARRLPGLRAALLTEPACAWGNIFCAAPELEHELSEAQASEWQAWFDEVARRKKCEVNLKVMPPPIRDQRSPDPDDGSSPVAAA